tara:strand:- start:41 stop:193 length:153 start_codon:yes stop_codon:yes gene_type:complete
MKRLTYRGTTYQKPEESVTEFKDWRRVTGDATHIYRGKHYHYEPKKKVVA